MNWLESLSFTLALLLLGMTISCGSDSGSKRGTGETTGTGTEIPGVGTGTADGETTGETTGGETTGGTTSGDLDFAELDGRASVLSGEFERCGYGGMLSIPDTYRRELLLFQGSFFTYEHVLSDQADCEGSDLIVDEYFGSYTVNAANEIDFVITDVTRTINWQENIDQATLQATCNVFSWELGIEQTVVGQQCELTLDDGSVYLINQPEQYDESQHSFGFDASTGQLFFSSFAPLQPTTTRSGLRDRAAFSR